MPLFVLFLAFSMEQVERLYARTLPYSHWVEYHSVIPPESVKAGEDLYFESLLSIRKVTAIEWIDTLYCKMFSGKYANYSQHFGHKRTGYNPELDKRVMWLYDGLTPSSPTQCKLWTQIKLEPVPGVYKWQDLGYGPEFWAGL